MIHIEINFRSLQRSICLVRYSIACALGLCRRLFMLSKKAIFAMATLYSAFVVSPVYSDQIGCLDGEIIQQDIVFQDFTITFSHSEDCLYSKAMDRAAYLSSRERSKTNVDIEVYMPGFIPHSEVFFGGGHGAETVELVKANVSFSIGLALEVIEMYKSRYIRDAELVQERGGYHEYHSVSYGRPKSVYVPSDDSAYFVVCSTGSSVCRIHGIFPEYTVKYFATVFGAELYDWKVIHRDIGDFVRESTSMLGDDGGLD